MVNADTGEFDSELSFFGKLLNAKMENLLKIFSGEEDVSEMNWSEWVDSIHQDLIAIY
jgi:hypothetical protein